ncbi:MAG: phosphopyruvate hydratase [Candidatus Portnoybacteria bacterium CG10_big_fil_rev_8_21_14_0_10_36_7]|uniref:Enolase n=1 Tax=Candidatus Portnoybacteria bacterium CG10_big_fil_rev_8_21_14_0_10_36_7 TaxID=1974812 RepID=A0A2M8KED7_9BACT|nr:MAG: phosphopyruvate hydratase [Candidatus Portnoybacteria bacterium CG10_big_fil_rev_8_21_14_0_10_36_7]
MAKIKSIIAREILDSRGNPTVEVEVVLDSGQKAWAGVPSGASTGAHEALELRDGDQKRYAGKGVLKAVNNINKKIAPKLIGLDPTKQAEIDKLMIGLDGTENKSKLGANAILGVSLAVARVGAITSNRPLYDYLRKKYWSQVRGWKFPVPTMNILNGGVHAGWSIDIQEFMVVPQQKNIKEAVRCGVEIFQTLKTILKGMGYPTTVGDEGGYAPSLSGNEKAFALMSQAVKKAGYNFGRDVKIAIDPASSEFFEAGKYHMKADKKIRTSAQMTAMYKNWLAKYPIESIEDGLSEDDWQGWKKLTNQLGKKVTLVGDDLFVTNVKKLKAGIEQGIGNAILIKLNQIGSVTETVETIKLAQKHKYKIAVSHRSGETVDDFIADLAVACGAEYIKTGSLSRGERVAKYNRLMEIWDEVK